MKHELKLLTGRNPGHFLAAMGLLRVMNSRGKSARLSWDDYYAPTLHCEMNQDDIAEFVTVECNRWLDPERLWLHESFGNKLPVDPAVLWAEAKEYGGNEEDLIRLAAIQEILSPKPDGSFSKPNTTPFHILGAGRSQFFSTARKLTLSHSETKQIFGEPQQYFSPGPIFRLDPQAVSPPYAYRADAPTGNPVPACRVVERLCLEALPLYPLTRAFRRPRACPGWDSRGWRFRWCLWSEPVGVYTACALQNQPALWLDEVKSICEEQLIELLPHGGQVLESRVEKIGIYRNLGIGAEIWPRPKGVASY